MSLRCQICQLTGSTVAFCSGCLCVAYCSAPHQLQDWVAGHSVECGTACPINLPMQPERRKRPQAFADLGISEAEYETLYENAIAENILNRKMKSTPNSYYFRLGSTSGMTLVFSKPNKSLVGFSKLAISVTPAREGEPHRFWDVNFGTSAGVKTIPAAKTLPDLLESILPKSGYRELTRYEDGGEHSADATLVGGLQDIILREITPSPFLSMLTTVAKPSEVDVRSFLDSSPHTVILRFRRLAFMESANPLEQAMFQAAGAYAESLYKDMPEAWRITTFAKHLNMPTRPEPEVIAELLATFSGLIGDDDITKLKEMAADPVVRRHVSGFFATFLLVKASEVAVVTSPILSHTLGMLGLVVLLITIGPSIIKGSRTSEALREEERDNWDTLADSVGLARNTRK